MEEVSRGKAGMGREWKEREWKEREGVQLWKYQ